MADIQNPDRPAAPLKAATAVLDSIFGPVDAPQDAPAAPVAETPQAAQAAPQSAEAAPPVAEAPKPAEAPKESLAALIRQQRQDREARQAKERESADLRTENEKLREQLARHGKSDIVGDPIGFAKSHGLTDAEIALVGQSYLYHLVPDKAPADLRAQLLEAKLARKERDAAAAQQTEARRAQEQAATQQIQQYATAINSAVRAWEAGQHPFPESAAWFGGNHDEYTESLVYTARNVAEAARVRGEVADLSPKAIAAALEQDLASRAARIRGTGSKPTQQTANTSTDVSGKQPAVLSTRGQGASPAPKATSDAERIKRAEAVVFASR